MQLSKTQSQTNRIIFFLSLIGIAIAIYVTQSFLRKTGVFCLNAGGCELVRKSPASYLFGFFPVPAVGLIGYTVLAVCAFLKTLKLSTFHFQLVTRVAIAMATFGVLFVGWFTYTELFVIKGVCTWCAISAVNMVVICALAWRVKKI
jgi:uncharacterized membrane protein